MENIKKYLSSYKMKKSVSVLKLGDTYFVKVHKTKKLEPFSRAYTLVQDTEIIIDTYFDDDNLTTTLKLEGNEVIFEFLPDSITITNAIKLGYIVHKKDRDEEWKIGKKGDMTKIKDNIKAQTYIDTGKTIPFSLTTTNFVIDLVA